MYLHYAQVYMLIRDLEHPNELQIRAKEQNAQTTATCIYWELLWHGNKRQWLRRSSCGIGMTFLTPKWCILFYWATPLPHQIASNSHKSINLEPQRVEEPLWVLDLSISGLSLKGKHKKRFYVKPYNRVLSY